MSSPQNLVHEVSTSTGTGDLTTSPVLGKQSFSDAFSTGGTDVFTYFISNKDADPTEWEVGTGHMSDVSTLVRDTVLNSSNSDSVVDFSTGSKHITNALPAEFYPDGDIVGTSDTQTLTNKTIAGYLATTAVSAATDADTLTTEGRYYVTSTASNIPPVSVNWLIEVHAATSTYCVQTARPITGTATSVWLRWRRASVWGAWIQLVSTAATQTLTNKTIKDYIPAVADRTALAGADTTNTPSVYLREDGREDIFAWDSSDFSDEVTADTEQGIYVPPTSDTTGASGAWIRKFKGPINAAWFGLKPNSVMTTGVYDALQAAIDEAGAGIEFNSLPAAGPYPRVNNKLIIPAGKFTVDSGATLRIPRGLRIEGMSRAATWILHAGGSVPCFDTDSSTSNTVEIALANLSIYGAGSTTTYGININDSIRNSEFTNVDIANCNINANLDDCWTLRMDNCNIHDAVTYNVVWGNATAATIRDSRIDAAGTSNFLITASSTTQYTIQLVFQNSKVQFAQLGGILLRDCDMAHIVGCYFEGNNKSGTGGAGAADIRMYNSAGNTRGTLLNVDNCYAASTGAGAATSRFIDIARGRLITKGCLTYSDGNYLYGVVLNANVTGFLNLGSIFNATTRISNSAGITPEEYGV